MDIFEHVPHPRIEERKKEKPAKVVDQFKRDNAAQRFNSSLAVGITKSVGTMWCGYAFAVLALVGLPKAIQTGGLALVQWISQTFLQLVLLSIIMVGQDVQAKASDKRADQTYKDAEAVLHEAREIQEHLKAQDDVLVNIISRVGGAPA